jgi:SnoaL-like domain
MMTDLIDILAVQQLIARFANSFDLKAWGDLRDCLTNTIHTDYFDLRGTPPETMSRERFVALRQSALHDLHTHHLSGNVEVQLVGTRGQARVSTVIFRRSASGDVLNTHCLYTFGIEKDGGHWAIHSIVQKVFWSDGQQSIHPGIVQP